MLVTVVAETQYLNFHQPLLSHNVIYSRLLHTCWFSVLLLLFILFVWIL